MKIFEFIGLSIYLVLIAILIVRQVNVSRNFRNNKIDEETHQKLTKRNTILLVIVGILLILFLYTPFKISNWNFNDCLFSLAIYSGTTRWILGDNC